MALMDAAPLAALLEREIAERENGARLLAEMVAGGYSEAAAARLVYAIRSGERKTVAVRTADSLLTALGLVEAWHTEPGLAEAAGFTRRGRRPDPVDGWCGSCEQWTLGRVCLWCDARTVTAGTLLERKARGQCELCRRRVRGTKGGHRLCRVHQPLLRRLGASPEERLGLAPPRPAQRRSHGLVSREQLLVLHRVYERDRLGVTAIAGLVWEQLGFRDATQAANAIAYGFRRLGLRTRPRAEAHKRNAGFYRRVGFGARTLDGRRLSEQDARRVYALYTGAEGARPRSAPELARELHAEFGYGRPEAFRGALEYAWRRLGLRMRSKREAELLSRRVSRRCAALTSGADGCRPRPCPQRPVNGSVFCLHHDPEHAEVVRERAARLRSLKRVRPTVAWADVLPLLGPLLVPRPDRLGRRLEKPGGALARQTGVPAGTCSRLMLGRRERITVELADRLLAPLGLDVSMIGEGARCRRAA